MNNCNWRQVYPPETPSSVTEGRDGGDADDYDVYCSDEDEKTPGTDATDSGYTSSQEEECSSETDATISSSDASDEEDVDDRIQYIHEKQQILKRAAAVLFSEEAYEAATALETTKLSHASVPTSATWKEAMSVLQTFGQSPSINSMTESSASSSSLGNPLRPSSRISGKKRKSYNKSNNCPRDPSINLSTVGRLSSVSYLQEQCYSSSTEQIMTQDNRVLELLSSMPPSIFQTGQWMAQALVRSAPLPLQHSPAHLVQSTSSTSTETSFTTVDHQGSWKMVSNPSTHVLGLAPPFGTSFMDHAVDIQEAMALSSQPRVLTQATPPFSIVYTNRAFLCLQVVAGGDSSSSSLIGQPIESIIQLVLDDSPNYKKLDGSNKQVEKVSQQQQQQQQQQHDTHYLNGLFPLKNNEACRIQIFPVIDRSRRRRISDDVDSNNGCDYTSMSHILVEVSPQVDENEGNSRELQPPLPSYQKRDQHGGPEVKTEKQPTTAKQVVVGTVG